MDFSKMALRDTNKRKYWSSLYKAIWKTIKQKKAVLDREFQYCLEPYGYPPIDVNEVVEQRFGRNGAFIPIHKPITELNETLTFWVVPAQYAHDAASHDQIIDDKIALHLQVSRIRDKLGHALVDMIHYAAHHTGLTYSTKLTEVKNWDGNNLSTSQGAIDIVLISFQSQTVYGIEAKNLAQIIERKYVTRKLMKHITNCQILGMKPVFIVSRIFPTAAKHLEQQGAVVIETEAQFYQKKYWAIARNLKQNLGYHFVRRVGHPKQIAVLSQKLSQVLV